LQEAAKAVFTSILRGGGPFGAFRPYLNQSVRNTAVSISRRRREAPIGGLEEIAEHGPSLTYDENDNAVDRMITVRAFKALPVRWQEVLWYTCVEGMPAREAATRLNLSPNAAAALAKRAREGLRRSWLEAHLSDERLSAQCRSVVRQLPAFERGALNPKSEAAVRAHLDECLRCGIVASELDHIAERLPMILVPLVGAGLLVFAKGVGMATVASGVGATVAGVGSVVSSMGGAGGVLPVITAAVTYLGHIALASAKLWWLALLLAGGVATSAIAGMGGSAPSGTDDLGMGSAGTTGAATAVALTAGI
jgi:RNA polymerase sigma factor (sigma-70 family)